MDQPENSGEPFDAAIVGGSFAGLSAALYLARGRRRVVLYDDGKTRNRFAPQAHGFLGHDGRPPDEVRLDGRREVLAYPTVTLRESRVVAVRGELDAFEVEAEDGSTALARRLILAHGVRDILPEIEGLAECWGLSAVQCPYCHGYELADRPTGALVTSHCELEHARMLEDWTRDLTILTNGHEITAEDRQFFLAEGARIEDGAVTALRHEGGWISAVRLADGRELPLEVLYLVARTEPASRLPFDLGCAMEEGPTGPHVQVDEDHRTSVPGVFAAGDLAKPSFGAPAAAADGAAAAVTCHRSLLGL